MAWKQRSKASCKSCRLGEKREKMVWVGRCKAATSRDKCFLGKIFILLSKTIVGIDQINF